MKVRFLWVGKTKSSPIRMMIDDYLGRIERFAPVLRSELRDRGEAGKLPAVGIKKEGDEILASVKEDSFVVVLDERGKEMKSRELAQMIEKLRGQGTRQMTFVIGGSEGLSEGVRARADMVLSLSRMTLTHEMARVLLLEQVYRAFAIIHGLPYER